MSKSIRMDFVFSYWIYIWYLLYELKITRFSPKFPLIIGLIDNIIMLLFMLLYGTHYKTILYFIIINIIIKIIPLYNLKNDKIIIKDIYFTVILFVIFIFWLHINKENLIGNLKLIYDSLLYNKGTTPFISFLSKLKNNFKELHVL